MITDVTVPARLCQCEALLKDGTPCAYSWITLLAPPRLPSTCQNRECRSREWNGKKERKMPEAKPVVILPKPKKVRKGEDYDF
jgi:hypothetical protein